MEDAACTSLASLARALPLDVVLRICSYLPGNEIAVTARLLCKEARSGFAAATQVQAGGLRDCDPLEDTGPSELERDTGCIGGVPFHAVRWLIRHADPSARGWLTLRQRFWLLHRTQLPADTPPERRQAPAAAGDSSSGTAAQSPATPAATTAATTTAAATDPGTSKQHAASKGVGAAAGAAPGVPVGRLASHGLWRCPPDGLRASPSDWERPPLLPCPLLSAQPPSSAAARLALATSPDAAGCSNSTGASSTRGYGSAHCPVSGFADTPPLLLLESMSYVLVDPEAVCRDALLAAAQWGDCDTVVLLARDALFRTTLFGPHAAASRDVVLADLIWAFCGGRVAPELLGWMFGNSSQSQAEAEVGAPFAEWRHSDVPYLAAAIHLHTLRTGSTCQAAEAPCTGSASSNRRHHKQEQEQEVERQRARSYALLDQIRAVGGFAFDGACVGTFLRAVWLAVTVLGGQGQELLSWLLDRGCPTGPPGWAYAAAMYPPPIGIRSFTHNHRSQTVSDPRLLLLQRGLPQAPVLEWLRGRGVPMGPDATCCVDRFWLLADCYSRYLQWVAEQGCSRWRGGRPQVKREGTKGPVAAGAAGDGAGGSEGRAANGTEAQAGNSHTVKPGKRRSRRARKAVRRLFERCLCGGGVGSGDGDGDDAHAADDDGPSRAPDAPALPAAEGESGRQGEDRYQDVLRAALATGEGRQEVRTDAKKVALARILCSSPDVCWSVGASRGIMNAVPGGPLDRALAHMRRMRERRPPALLFGSASGEGS